MINPDQAADVAGTCAMFCIATDGINEELSKPENELIFNSGTLENTYFYWGFIRTGGLALRWYRDNVCNEAGNGAYFDELNEKCAMRIQRSPVPSIFNRRIWRNIQC